MQVLSIRWTVNPSPEGQVVGDERNKYHTFVARRSRIAFKKVIRPVAVNYR